MKKSIALLAFLLGFSSLCWAGGSQEEGAQPPQQKTAQAQQQTQSAPPYWTGDGGKGKILSIRKLRPTGLAANENTIPALVQGELHNNFSNYTAIATSTEESRNEQYAELLGSGHYDDNAGVDLGHLREPDYIMEGTITRTAIGFALHINVTKVADKSTVASFSETCTFDELNDLTAVRRASLYLMEKMGVTPTKLAKTELARPAVSNEVAALNALAMRDTAKTEFEKGYYTYQAAQLNPALAEAARQLAAYQMEIYKAPEISLAMPNIKMPEIRAPQFKAPEIKMAATGNIGADARKQVEQYNAQKEASRLRQESGNKAVKDLQDAFLEQFKVQSETVKKQQADLLGQRGKLLEQQKALLARQRQMITQLRETENSYDTFFTEHPPFELIYDPAVKPVGIANLEKGTIDMEFRITSAGTQAMEVIPLMLADFEKGLAAITQGLKDINAELDKIESLLADAEAAGKAALERLVNDYAAQVTKVAAAEDDYAAQLARLDTALKTTGYAQLGRDYAVRTDAGYAERLAGQFAVQPVGYNAAQDKTLGDTWTLAKWNRDDDRTFVIGARLENNKGKTISIAAVDLTNRILAAAYTHPMSSSASCVFRNVPVSDITDTMKVVIQRVNDRDVTAFANTGYIKISPLEANGYTKDGWDIAGYGKNGRNQMGLTRREIERPAKDVEKAEKKAVRQARIDNMWGGFRLGAYIGGAGSIQPSGGLFEFGYEAGGKWLVVDGGIGWGGGSLNVDDEMVEEILGPGDWGTPHIFCPRVGAAIPLLKFERARLNIGGGCEWLIIEVSLTKGELDTLVIPYVGARLDFALTQKGTLQGYIGYRHEFTPAGKMEIYFGEPSSRRHTIFAGLAYRDRFPAGNAW